MIRSILRVMLWGAFFAASAAQALEIRVNAGGPQYTDSQSRVWSADTGYNAGDASDWCGSGHTYANTNDSPLYQSERWDPDVAPELRYAFTVPNGNYIVRLHFSECPYTSVGQRIFNVKIEGQTRLSNYDIIADVGHLAAAVKTFSVAVVDGELDIDFEHVVENPSINGIEIVSAGDDQPPSVPAGLTATRTGSGQSTWTQVASEGGSFTLTSAATVRYGANSSWVSLTLSPGTHACTNEAFGSDPLFGTVKRCEKSSAGAVVDVQWSPSTDNVGVTHYVLQSCSGASCSNFAQLASPTTNSYVDPNPGSGPVRYRVQACDAAGLCSAFSSPVQEGGAGQTAALRLKAGSSGFTDSHGNVWISDAPYVNTGNPIDFGSTVQGTSDPQIYSSERWDDESAPEMRYSIPVSNGTYTVKLHFAENSFGSQNYRVFNVDIEGVNVLANLDILAEAGFKVAYVRTFTVTVTDGELNIEFRHVHENPLINGIEVIPVSNGGAPSTPTGLQAAAEGASQLRLIWSASTGSVSEYRVQRCDGVGCTNFAQVGALQATTYLDAGLSATTYRYRVIACDAVGQCSAPSTPASGTPSVPTSALRIKVGDNGFTDSQGRIWVSDTAYFDVGNASIYPNEIISGTSDPYLYRSERWIAYWEPDMHFSAPVANGDYVVKLHFAENFYSAAGQRIFDVDIEGQNRINHLDLIATVGMHVAHVKEFNVTVSDGALDILFRRVHDSPIINGIEILGTGAGGGTDTEPPTVPGSFAATGGNNSSAQLTWTPSTDNVQVAHYQVQRCSGGGCTPYQQIAFSSGSPFNDSNLPDGVYRYRIRACDPSGNCSPYTGVQEVSVSGGGSNGGMSAPTSLRVNPGTLRMTLTWNPSGGPTTGYVIERCAGVNCTGFEQVGTSSGTTFVDTNVVPGRIYSYRVYATDGMNFGEYSGGGSGVSGQCD